jgi:hypothetical protein
MLILEIIVLRPVYVECRIKFKRETDLFALKTVLYDYLYQILSFKETKIGQFEFCWIDNFENVMIFFVA